MYSVFITFCNIIPVHDDRTVLCAITHFPFACIEIYIVTWNAINIHFGKSQINQLRRMAEKTPFTVPGSAPRAPLLAERCDLGSIISALPLDLKPIIWWWSRSGGCECDVFGCEGRRNRINHQTVLERAHFAVYCFSLRLTHGFHVHSFLLSFLSEWEDLFGFLMDGFVCQRQNYVFIY